MSPTCALSAAMGKVRGRQMMEAESLGTGRWVFFYCEKLEQNIGETLCSVPLPPIEGFSIIPILKK